MFDELPKLWTDVQNKALETFYYSIYSTECELTFDEKVKFWKLYNKLNGINIHFSPNVKWHHRDEDISMVILCEYNFLDMNNLIKIK